MRVCTRWTWLLWSFRLPQTLFNASFNKSFHHFIFLLHYSLEENRDCRNFLTFLGWNEVQLAWFMLVYCFKKNKLSLWEVPTNKDDQKEHHWQAEKPVKPWRQMWKRDSTHIFIYCSFQDHHFRRNSSSINSLWLFLHWPPYWKMFSAMRASLPLARSRSENYESIINSAQLGTSLLSYLGLLNWAKLGEDSSVDSQP